MGPVKTSRKELVQQLSFLQVTVSSQTPLLKGGDCRLLLGEVFYRFPESFRVLRIQMFEIVGFSFVKQTSDSIACRFKIGTELFLFLIALLICLFSHGRLRFEGRAFLGMHFSMMLKNAACQLSHELFISSVIMLSQSNASILSQA